MARLRPLILTCWGSDINSLSSSPKERVERVVSALAAADYVTGGSRQLLDRCEQLVGRRLRTRVFRFGVDLEQFAQVDASQIDALRHRLGIPSGSQVVLSSRRLYPNLGQEHILQAFARVVHDMPAPGAVLVFRRYLSERKFEDALKARVSEYGLGGRVYWLDETGYETVPVQYAMADLVVNYPERDGLPLSLFEAAAARRPIISSDLPSYRDVFGSSLLLVPAGDPQALAEALKVGLASRVMSARVEETYARACEAGDQRKCLRDLTDVFSLTIPSGRRR